MAGLNSIGLCPKSPPVLLTAAVGCEFRLHRSPTSTIIRSGWTLQSLYLPFGWIGCKNLQQSFHWKIERSSTLLLVLENSSEVGRGTVGWGPPNSIVHIPIVKSPSAFVAFFRACRCSCDGTLFAHLLLFVVGRLQITGQTLCRM